MMPEFKPFPKIPRLRRTIIVTEKIDGTNAQVHITADGQVYAGSRNKWITPETDNYGFARWVDSNKTSLLETMGVGTHYGEWWGSGIQRRYGLSGKRFSLFNSYRWKDTKLPDGVFLVPTLYIGEYSDNAIQDCLDRLRKEGSLAQPGFMQPEGVVVYMQASGTMHKVLLENDALPKGKVPYAEKLANASGPFAGPDISSAGTSHQQGQSPPVSATPGCSLPQQNLHSGCE